MDEKVKASSTSRQQLSKSPRIYLRCPSCDSPLGIKEISIGKVVTCPKCSGKISLEVQTRVHEAHRSQPTAYPITQPATTTTAETFPSVVSVRTSPHRRKHSLYGAYFLYILLLGFGFLLGLVYFQQATINLKEAEKTGSSIASVPIAAEEPESPASPKKIQSLSKHRTVTEEQSRMAKVNLEGGPKPVREEPVVSGFGNSFSLLSVRAEPSNFDKDQTVFTCTVKIRNTSGKALTTFVHVHLYDIGDKKIASSGLVKSSFATGETRSVSTILSCPNDKVDFVDSVKADVRASF
ncbi:MAG: hypothetical protein GXP26_07485 [Planctomycetes bacterium]|nr:hypothetical protein [Planctomycetota bacterium]